MNEVEKTKQWLELERLGFTVKICGGYAPFQIEGERGGLWFYFRARYESCSIEIRKGDENGLVVCAFSITGNTEWQEYRFPIYGNVNTYGKQLIRPYWASYMEDEWAIKVFMFLWELFQYSKLEPEEASRE